MPPKLLLKYSSSKVKRTFFDFCPLLLSWKGVVSGSTRDMFSEHLLLPDSMGGPRGVSWQYFHPPSFAELHAVKELAQERPWSPCQASPSGAESAGAVPCGRASPLRKGRCRWKKSHSRGRPPAQEPSARLATWPIIYLLRMLSLSPHRPLEKGKLSATRHFKSPEF